MEQHPIEQLVQPITLLYGQIILCLRLLSSQRVIVCIRFGKANAKKTQSWLLKNTWFYIIQCYTQNETSFCG